MSSSVGPADSQGKNSDDMRVAPPGKTAVSGGRFRVAKTKVCMFVFNNFTHDSRVLKEAKTLTDAGYDVRVLALLDANTKRREIVEGFRVLRVAIDPVHLRMLGKLRVLNFLPWFQRLFAPVVKAMNSIPSPRLFFDRLVNSLLSIIRRVPSPFALLSVFVASIAKGGRSCFTALKGVRDRCLSSLSNFWKQLCLLGADGASENTVDPVRRSWGFYLLGWMVIWIPPLVFGIRKAVSTLRTVLIDALRKSWVYHPLVWLWEHGGYRIYRRSRFFFLQLLKFCWFWMVLQPFRLLRGAWRAFVVTPLHRTLRWFLLLLKKTWQNFILSPTRRLTAWQRRFRKQIWQRLVLSPSRWIRTTSYSLARDVVLKYHRPFCFQDFYRRSFSEILSEPADIYQAHDLNTLPVAWWAARKHGAKLVYDSHELYLDRNRVTPRGKIDDYLLSRMEKFLVQRCDAVITVNQSIAKVLSERYRIPEPHILMNAPVAKSHVEQKVSETLRSLLSIPSDHYILLYCGGITFNRGLEKVIESLTYLPDCYLVFMGYGSDNFKEELQTIADELGVASRFSFFGPVPSSQVTTFAACADLGVAPIENVCLSYYYCSPNKVFEYLNAGLPVIASDFPEMRSVIDEFEVGAVFDPGDPQDIARAARGVLDNPEISREMKQKTIKAAKQFNWENEAVKFLSIYRSIG